MNCDNSKHWPAAAVLDRAIEHLNHKDAQIEDARRENRALIGMIGECIKALTLIGCEGGDCYRSPARLREIARSALTKIAANPRP